MIKIKDLLVVSFVGVCLNNCYYISNVIRQSYEINFKRKVKQTMMLEHKQIMEETLKSKSSESNYKFKINHLLDNLNPNSLYGDKNYFENHFGHLRTILTTESSSGPVETYKIEIKN